MDLRKSLKLVRERKLLFILATVAALILLLLRPTVQPGPPHYVSHAHLLLTPSQPASPEGVRGSGSVPLQTWFASEALLRELMTSEDLLARVLNRLSLKQDWQALKAQIRVKPLYVDNSSEKVTLLEVAVAAEDPKDAQLKTEALVNEFIQYTQELSAAEFANSRKFLAEQASEAKIVVDKTQNVILKYREKLGGKSPTEVATTKAEHELQVQGQLTQLQSKAAELIAQAKELDGFLKGSSNVPPWSVLDKNDSLAELSKRLNEGRAKLNSMSEVYQANADVVVEARARVEQDEALYTAEISRAVQAQLQEKLATLAGTEQSINTLKRELHDLRQHGDLASQMELAEMEHKLEAWEKTYGQLNTQLYSAKVAEQASRRQGSITILERPQPGTLEIVAVERPRGQQLALVIPFSLLLGLAAVFLADYLSTSMELRPRVIETLNLPILGEVPAMPEAIVTKWTQNAPKAKE